MLNDHLRRRREARVAARLVGLELAFIGRAAAELWKRGRAPASRVPFDLAMRRDAWATHGFVLARELPNEAWETLATLYFAVPGIEGWVKPGIRTPMKTCEPSGTSMKPPSLERRHTESADPCS